jgi:flagellar biosynthesis anti-sigma factor FlgM
MVDPVSFHPVGRVQTKVDVPSPPVRFAKPEPEVAAAAPSLSRLVNLAKELQQQGPPVDYVRIAQVRQAIAQRSYQIDAGAIAKAIVNFGKHAKT